MLGGITVEPIPGAMACFFGLEAFKPMIAGEICDAARAQEVVQSIAVDSRQALDVLAAKVEKAGGRLVNGPPQDMPWGRVFGFADPDGHVWAVLWFEQRG